MFHRMMKGLHPNGWRCSIDSFIRCGQEPCGHTTQGDPSDANALLVATWAPYRKSLYKPYITWVFVGYNALQLLFKYHKYKDIERLEDGNKYNYCSFSCFFTTPNILDTE